ncbi:MOSC domain-containing protein [Domibacillus indicus]|uniref:MOSC domain-containing protein n=1 Tax=Domibacillus indicus TaxID=1437523 RepID=UPI000617EB52|nr:MOSC domain-containing protein [Domibacillus indicus]
MKLISLNTGRPSELPYKKKTVSSGIKKSPVEAPIYLSRTGFEGDGQADLVHHGGADKAVCVYPFEHYTYWEKEFKEALPVPAFGENVTAAGLLETDMHIGDTFQLGEAIVQISQPRQPCFKLAALHNTPKLAFFVEQTGYTGFYFRVTAEGTVSPKSELKRLTVHPSRITVSEANRIMNDKNVEPADIGRLLEINELAESWKKPLRNRLSS